MIKSIGFVKFPAISCMYLAADFTRASEASQLTRPNSANPFVKITGLTDVVDLFQHFGDFKVAFLHIQFSRETYLLYNTSKWTSDIWKK